MQDIRYAVRMLLKNPAFSLIAILTLALGIGANTAIFSVVDAVLLRPLPYPDPERLVTLTVRTTRGDRLAAVSPLTFQFWLQNETVFDGFAATSDTSFNIVTAAGAERVDGLEVTSGFFHAIGVQPFLGRGFLPGEDRPGTPAVVVLSYPIWRQFYGGASDVVGKQIRLNDSRYTVIGVMPNGFSYPGLPRAVYSPLTLIPDPKDRGSNYAVVARLKRGIQISIARAEMERLHGQFRAAYPDFVPSNVVGAGLTPFQDLVNADIRPLLNLLLAAVGAVLLIASTNVANLLLSRTAARRKEVAIRVAVGAGSGRILRQLVMESLVLSSTAGAAGVLLARWSVHLLVRVNPDLVERAAAASLNLRVLAFSCLISLLTGLIFGATGVLQARRFDPQKALKSETLGQSPEHRRLSNVFMVSEVALAMVLLVSASFLIMTFHRLKTIPFGFNTENLLTVELGTSSARYNSAAAVDRFERELRDRVRAIPGVLSVATASGVPLVRTYNHTASIGNQSDTQPVYVEYRSVSPEYFETLGVRLVRGRIFIGADSKGSMPVVLINESFAHRFSSNVDPIGQRLTIGKNSPQEEAPREIVGIVSDISDRPPGTRISPTVYVVRSQASDKIQQSANSFFPYSACLIRTAGAVDIDRQLRQIVAQLDPQVPVTHIRTIQEILSDSVEQERFNMFIMSVFAGVALVLTIVGLYGVVSYQVAQRTREIGVRLALGGSRAEILRVTMGRGISLLGIGIAIGLAVAFAFMQLLSDVLYGVTATNLWIYGGVSALMTVVAIVATYIPARRATHIDPLVALRYD